VQHGNTSHEVKAEELDRFGNWVLMSVCELDGAMTAVFEDFENERGSILFVTEDGVTREFSKSLEPTTEQGYTWYRGHPKPDVLPGMPDILRDELLAGGGDPDPEQVRACFPPIRRSSADGLEKLHTFTGTAISNDVIPHYYIDVPMVSRVPTEVVAPETARAIRDETLWEGLVGGWLPIIRTVYPIGEQECWEVIVLATPEGATLLLQPTWYRFTRLRDGQVQEVRYVDSFIAPPGDPYPRSEGFYRALVAVRDHWESELSGSMRLTTPEPWIADACRHALVLERITRRGAHPKYGVVERAYEGEEHDGFQDALTSTVICTLEWGLLHLARAYLDYYLTHFVRIDGRLKYRGPEIGKFGVMLTCIATYYDYSRDETLICEHDQKIKAIVALLVGRWESARRCDPSDPTYGMIRGPHEADIGFLRQWEDSRRLEQEAAGASLPGSDYEQPYLSNSAEAWRGLRDIALSWRAVSLERDDSELADRAAKLLEQAELLLQDARRGSERTWLRKDGVEGLPIIAGSSTFYWEAPYRTSPESFDENRVWSELLHSGVASKETVERILQIAAQRGGSTLGIFTNRADIVGFLVAEAVSGMLQHDLIPEALLVFYAHAFHAHSAGTWTAVECVDMDRARARHNPYCVPAQMTVPTIARWLLAFEEPVERSLVLAMGVPRTWFRSGETFGVEGCPTRFGMLSYTVQSHLDQGHVRVLVALPPRSGASVRVRLRLPAGYVAERVEVANRADVHPVLDGEFVSLPVSTRGRLDLRVLCTSESAAQAADERSADSRQGEEVVTRGIDSR
jgi:hypothetical protein